MDEELKIDLDQLDLEQLFEMADEYERHFDDMEEYEDYLEDL